jgi:hypothetical protein
MKWKVVVESADLWGNVYDTEQEAKIAADEIREDYPHLIVEIIEILPKL